MNDPLDDAIGADGRVKSDAPVIRSFREGDAEAWNGYVLAHPEGTFFHLAEWREVLRRAFGHATHYLLAERNGVICGVLPLAELRSLLFGHALVSTPFCSYGGIVSSDLCAHRELTTAASNLARTLGVDHLEMRNRQRLHPDWACRDLYVTFRRPISPDSEENMLAIPRKQRAMVRKGIKAGLASRLDDGTTRHYALYSESLRRLGTPVFSRCHLDVLREVFRENCEVLLIMQGEQAVASCMSFYFRDEVLPYYAGGTLAARSVGGNDFMYWEIMERARQRGSRLFDFGRSKRGTGAFDFKTYWGFEPQPLYYEYALVKSRSTPDLSPANPRYQRMIATWRRLPLPLTQFIGPPIAKYLG